MLKKARDLQGKCQGHHCTSAGISPDGQRSALVPGKITKKVMKKGTDDKMQAQRWT